MDTQYKDRFSESEEELSEKSAYICTSCNTDYSTGKGEKQVRAAGAEHSATLYKDRFSEAEDDLSEKSAYRCTSCDTYYTSKKHENG